MKKKCESLDHKTLAALLGEVRMPGRYIGGEVNSGGKEPREELVKFGMCFPDVYEIAMSNTAVSILQDMVNKLPWGMSERIFTPWTDAITVMKEKGIALFSLESKLPAACFDMLGFSITTELCHTNILAMLDLAGLELRSRDRSNEDAIILGGGQIANSCEPLAEFFDIFLLGDGEDALCALLELYREHKSRAEYDKDAFLLEAAQRFEWAYVPKFYEMRSNELHPLIEGLRTRFENAVVKDFENAYLPEKPIVPFVEAVHERVSIEIMRGCPGRCRFCQASFTKRPLRFRSVETIVQAAIKNYEATGFDTVSLLSLSTADYPWLEELVERLNEYFVPRKVGISLPSLRVDKQLELVPKLATSVRKSGLTIAVEAASENLRRMINKKVTNELLFKAVRSAYEVGYRRVKLYFMVGFPNETEDDIRAIADLSAEVSAIGREVTGRAGDVSAAISWLIPKPHTPFQWFGQKDAAYFDRATEIILERKRELRLGKKVMFKFHDRQRSVLEAVLARGGRELCDVVEDAYRAGAIFDLWDEHFNFELWEKCFEQRGIDYREIAEREFAPDEPLPWNHLGGPPQEYLERHRDKAQHIIEEV
jgi:radical SAM family uncharacterized protein